MNSLNQIISISIGLLLMFTACSQPLTISEVDYSHSIESVLETDSEGVIHDVRHGIKFNVMPLQYAETSDTSSVDVEEVRLIRDSQGFYYITSPGFTNVYVMTPEKNSLKLKKKIKISDEGISKPAFNQKKTHVQLLNRESNETYLLSSEGIEKSSNSNSKNSEEAK